MIPAKIRRQLEQVDWDFSSHLPGTSKTIHWYPGTFPADIPTTLIQALTKPSQSVFDPYGGTGTAGLESVRQARTAFLVEANPIGVLSSYVAGGALLLKSFRPELLRLLFSDVRQILEKLQNKQRRQLTLHPELGNHDSAREASLATLMVPSPADLLLKFSSPPNYERLAPWFGSSTLRDFRALLEAFSDPNIGAFARLAGITMISAILRPASSQTRSWGHIADNVWPKEMVEKDVFRLALQWLKRFESIIENTQVARSSNLEPRFWVSHHNWLSPSSPAHAPPVKSSLLVTSPPYAGAIDYTLAQRLSLYALGYSEEDLGQFWRCEFGARRKRNFPHSLEVWAEELAAALDRQLSFLGSEALAAFILPHKDEGRDLGTQVLEDCLASNRWDKVMSVDRSIRQVRARQSWTSIKRETIHIFCR